MKVNNNYIILLFISMLVISCSSFYKKSALYQDQIETISNLELEIDSLQKEISIALVRAKNQTLPTTTKDGNEITQEVEPLDTPVPYLEELSSKEQEVTILNHIKNKATSIRLRFRDATFDTYVLENAADIRLFWKNRKGKIIGNLHELKDSLERSEEQMIFATNAGMFHPDQSPVGLYVEEGEEIIPLNTDENRGGNFFLKPNGVFLIKKDQTAEVVITEGYEKYKDQVWYATQSGPMAVIDGEIHPAFNEPSKNLRIRSGVGVDKEGRVVFAISNIPVNFYTFGSLFKDVFECSNALYLDGSISRMYLPTLGRQERGISFGPLIGVGIENEK